MSRYDWDDKAKQAAIVGRTITAIHWGEDRLTFDTDAGLVSFEVDGDCCSQSYFFDLYGVRNLLDNGPVTAFETVDLSSGDPGYRAETWEPTEDSYESIQVYGYRFTTEHPTFGPVSSVLSFRNSSNGYYGGSMYVLDDGVVHGDQRLVTEDVIGGVTV